MPPSAAYAFKESVQLSPGQTRTLSAQFVEAIQIEVTQGAVRFETTAVGGIKPTGCANRCLTQLASDTLRTDELSGFAISPTADSQGVRARGRNRHTPVKVSADLGAGEYIQYSGDFNVTLTASSSEPASLSISTSSSELVDPAPLNPV